MSDETKKKLQDAKAHLEAMEKSLTTSTEALFSDIASNLPDRMQEIAKKAAFDQPDVAKALGADGIKALRDKLREQAESYAAEVKQLASTFKWKPPHATLPLEQTDVRTNLWELFRQNGIVDGLAKTFREHNFDTNLGSRRQVLVNALDLYSNADTALISAVSVSWEQAQQAQDAFEKAKKADDHSDVSAIWGSD